MCSVQLIVPTSYVVSEIQLCANITSGYLYFFGAKWRLYSDAKRCFGRPIRALLYIYAKSPSSYL